MEDSMFENRLRSQALSITLAFVATLLATSVQAAEGAPAPVQLALWNPVQMVDAERSVRGFRFSLLWGVNRNVTGLDISMLANEATGTVRGYQWSLALNEVGGDFTGYQSSLVNGVGGDLEGFQGGLIGNYVDGHMEGFQLGAGSSAGEVTGLQIGIVNSMNHGKGLQLGALNLATEMRGLQLGLLNFNENGFLPWFPIFNFGL
jgi:hypothetical protein